MTTSRKNEAAALWTEALMRPDQRTLLESLAADLAEYTGRPIDEVLADMASAKDRFAARWCKDDPAAKGEEAVRAFYSEDLLEAYELAFWHGGGCGEPPLNYAAAAMMLRENGASRVLDFGSGIGSGALVLAKAGLQPDIADIARPLLGYASARLQRRGINHRAIDLNTEAVPSNTYNAVCCFDVLEHVQNPFRVVNQLAQALKVGGVLLCNLPGTDDGSRPMHITAFHDRTMFVLRTAVCRNHRAIKAAVALGADFTVLRKRRFGRAWNRILLTVLRLKRFVFRQPFGGEAYTTADLRDGPGRGTKQT